MKKLFYYIPNTYSAQIEGSGINLRIGYTAIGVRLIPLKYWRGQARHIPFLFKILFPISLGFNYHSGQSNRIFRFKFEFGCFSIWYLTKGEGAEKGYTGLHSSFHYDWRNKPTRQNYYKLF